MAIAETTAADQEIADRDRRAATEAMTVVNTAPAMFAVYTATEVYRVDLKIGGCTCPDSQYRRDEIEYCKHERRVLMALGEREIPTGVAVDYVLAQRPAVEADA
jgi:hypothetical protein